MNVQLTPEQIREANDALMHLNRLLPQVQALQSCGEDCQQRLAKINHYKTRIELLLQTFGPGVGILPGE